ncbi:Dihydrofolate synthase [Fructilactobacillus florum 8D]|uniref:tetrahydrofolate synthase n=1 Tax=Fructilactobacillus florum 8D TaxID=1221538 RepID=W9ECP3_9LACO|nr:cyanophycin synthetase [Fructilactobacillus florum]ETO39878.1 Dihydrofolate synthase [Fructilactobacillus florum 8D]
MINDYQAALAYIHGRPRLQKDSSQRRIGHLLAQLGHPEHNVRTVHVVGTNGKGSATAYLSRLLAAVSLRVGMYTSPFLHRFNERIVLNGQPIRDDQLVTLVQKIKPMIDETEQTEQTLIPTEFEVITALMYEYFAEQRVDVAVVEAGIGGRSDSTNVSDQAILTMITTIGKDHMNLLGQHLETIAANKAGMIRPNVPTVCGQLPQAALAPIIQQATSCRSRLFFAQRDFLVQPLGLHQFRFQNRSVCLSELDTKMLGDFEMEDAGMAIQAFWVLNEQYQWLERAQAAALIYQEVPKVRWGGRLELVQTDPPVLIDGAHNVPAIKRVIQAVQQFNYQSYEVVFSAYADKEASKMLEAVQKLPAVHITVTNLTDTERATAPLKSQHGITYQANWQAALKLALVNADHRRDCAVLVTGSLHFISQVRTWFLG